MLGWIKRLLTYGRPDNGSRDVIRERRIYLLTAYVSDQMLFEEFFCQSLALRVDESGWHKDMYRIFIDRMLLSMQHKMRIKNINRESGNVA